MKNYSFIENIGIVYEFCNRLGVPKRKILAKLFSNLKRSASLTELIKLRKELSFILTGVKEVCGPLYP
jgi:hypothetical protein